MSIGICACGGTIKTHSVKWGTAYTCKACGCYEVVPEKSESLEVLLDMLGESLEETNTQP